MQALAGASGLMSVPYQFTNNPVAGNLQFSSDFHFGKSAKGSEVEEPLGFTLHNFLLHCKGQCGPLVTVTADFGLRFKPAAGDPIDFFAVMDFDGVFSSKLRNSNLLRISGGLYNDPDDLFARRQAADPDHLFWDSVFGQNFIMNQSLAFTGLPLAIRYNVSRMLGFAGRIALRLNLASDEFISLPDSITVRDATVGRPTDPRIPEPATLITLGLGAAGFLVAARWRRKS